MAPGRRWTSEDPTYGSSGTARPIGAEGGRHTGRTDAPLTAAGEREATALRRRFGGRRFALVLSSPLSRARETCHLAGYGDVARAEDDLREWDYGVYEGRTTAEIQRETPGWTIWEGEVPGGETAAEVGRRADRVIRQATEAGGDVALFISAREEKERKTLFPLFVALTFALSLAVMALAETKSDSARHNRSANVVWEFPAVNSL